MDFVVSCFSCFSEISRLKFIRLLGVVFSSQQGVITTRSNRMKFRLRDQWFQVFSQDKCSHSFESILFTDS